MARPISVFTVSMASGGTLTTYIDLGGSWENCYLQVPSMISNTQHHIQTATDYDQIYRRVKHPAINSLTVGTNDFAITSSATNCVIPMPNGLRFIKIETTATVDSGETYKIICAD